jgi:hypothetical protein
MRETGPSGDSAKADGRATMLEKFGTRGGQQSLAYLRAGGGRHVDDSRPFLLTVSNRADMLAWRV